MFSLYPLQSSRHCSRSQRLGWEEMGCKVAYLREEKVCACAALSVYIYVYLLTGAISMWVSKCHWPWWHHQMETFSALLALCAGNSPVSGEFPSQRPVTRNFDIFFDLGLNKPLSKQLWGWWFETPSRSLWRHGNTRLWNMDTCLVCAKYCRVPL